MKLLIAKAPENKITNWDIFETYIEEASPNLYTEVKKYGQLGEFILNRSK
jgi:hypothetical protein